MFKKLIKSMLCATILVTGLTFNPLNVKAAQIDDTLQPMAAQTVINVSNQSIYLPVKLPGYGTNYILVKFNGSYTHNTSGSTYWLTNNTLTRTLMSNVSYYFDPLNNVYETEGRLYEVSGFSVRSFTAPSANPRQITINYTIGVRLIGEENYTIYTGSKTVTFTASI